MRIAYIGTDSFANCAMALLDDGHEITHILSTSPRPFTPRIEDVAKRAGIRVQRRGATRADIERIVAEGAEVILCVTYPRRIPAMDCGIPAVNMHPSPLPEGRGPAPFEWAILQGRTETGVTIHEMVERFDAGPILWQRAIAIRPNDTDRSLRDHCREVAEAGVVEVFRDFERLWDGRRPQGPGTYCKLPRRADRTLEFASDTARLDRQLRAFAPGYRLAVLEGRTRRIGEARCWPEDHGHAPGTVIARKGRHRTVAAADGLIEMEVVREPLVSRLRRLAWPMYRRVMRR